MPEYLSPGVYVEEVDTGPKPIEGVSTSTSGMVGVTEWGPEGIPTLVTGFAEFRRLFGGYLDDDVYKDAKQSAWYLPHAVEGFFQNGGKRVYIVRVLPTDAETACVYLADLASTPTVTTTLDAAAAAGTQSLTVTSDAGITEGMLLKLDDGQFTEYVVAAADADGSNTVQLETPLYRDHLEGVAVEDRTALLKIQAIDRGTWGDSLRVTPDDDESILETTLAADAAQDDLSVTLKSTQGAETGTILDFYIQKTIKERKINLTAQVGDDIAAGAIVRIQGSTWETTLCKDAATADTAIYLENADSIKKDDVLDIIFTDSGTTTTVNATVESVAVTLSEALGMDIAADTVAYVRDSRVETSVTADAAAADTTVKLENGVGAGPGAMLLFRLFQTKVEAVSGKVITIKDALPMNVSLGLRVRSREFKLRVDCIQTNPATGMARTIGSETHRQLSLDPRHSRYAITIIGPIPDGTIPLRADGRTDGEGQLIRVEDPITDEDDQKEVRLPELVLHNGPVGLWLTGGDDKINTLTDQDYVGQDNVDPKQRTGLAALKNIEEVSIVAMPGRTSQKAQEALIDHCELLRYRFAVIDSRKGDGMAEVQEQRGLYDTKYAGLYYPWLSIEDPFPQNPQAPGQVLLPPSGHMMGIYARSDIERGVHKAPANEVIRGISDLEVKLMKEHQDILNPRNINVLRNFRENNRGLRVWGARTISSDPDWKYINVRRLFIFIEHSIDRGTQWVVFEPNSEPLWERVRRVITSFLTNVWRDGALMGKTKEEAFFVKCDRTTMTQDDIDNGRLIVQIGIAPVKPAEFVIFRIGQWVGGSSVEEG